MSREDAVEMMREMLLIREFEKIISQLSSERSIPGWLHVSIGQEAVAVGACSTLGQNDWVVSGHRAHGHAIAKGVPLKRLAAELFGKKTGCCKGRGGSMHVIDREYHVLCTSFVGSGFPIASGLALSSRLQSKGAVVAAFAGDGASNTGAFHESLNLCSVWKLPVIFIIENNQYAVSTHVSRSTSAREISKRGESYEIPSFTIDGNDAAKVRQTVSQMVLRAREGKGPSLVECLTYRTHGHYEGEDWEVYRSKSEVQAWLAKDPIPSMRKYLLQMGVDEPEIESMGRQVQNEISDAISFAKNSPDPDPSELSSYVFS